MSVCFNDLEKLTDILDNLEPTDVKDITDKDIEDFKESIQYFISDYIDTHIECYKKKDFETTMFEDLCKLIRKTYNDIFTIKHILVYIKLYQ